VSRLVRLEKVSEDWNRKINAFIEVLGRRTVVDI
jgi:hypothetical protein